MIEINLVPEHLRKKRKPSHVAKNQFTLPQETFLGIAVGFALLLIFFHLLLQGLIFMKLVKQKNLKKEMEGISQDKNTADQMIQELRTTQSKLNSLEGIVGENKFSFSQKLNEISDNLPKGVWLNKILLEEGTLLIQGSAVSKNRTEILYVHSFTSKLKNSRRFMSNIKNIELGLIKSRKINNTQLADFHISTFLK